MKILKTANYKKLAGRKGNFKYECEDCGEFTNLSARERSSRSMPRCSYCGSTWIEPVTEYSRGRVQEGQDAHDESVDLFKQKQNFQ